MDQGISADPIIRAGPIKTAGALCQNGNKHKLASSIRGSHRRVLGKAASAQDINIRSSPASYNFNNNSSSRNKANNKKISRAVRGPTLVGADSYSSSLGFSNISDLINHYTRSETEHNDNAVVGYYSNGLEAEASSKVYNVNNYDLNAEATHLPYIPNSCRHDSGLHNVSPVDYLPLTTSAAATTAAVYDTSPSSLRTLNLDLNIPSADDSVTQGSSSCCCCCHEGTFKYQMICPSFLLTPLLFDNSPDYVHLFFRF